MNASTSSQPVALRISVTDRCQMRCLYCMPPEGVPKVDQRAILTFEEILRFVRIVQTHFGLSKVRITGGEPLVRLGIVELVRMLSRHGVDDLALTTNGQRLAAMAPGLKRAGLHRVNVSLDSLDEKMYAALSRGGDMRAALQGIEAAIRCGLAPVKINTVLLRGYNDHEVTRLAAWAIERGCTIRFLELMSIGRARRVFSDLFVSSAEVRAALEKCFDLTPVVHRRGATSRNLLAADREGRQGVVGLISSVTQPFCDGCSRLRLTSTGRLISCLARGEGRDLRPLLRSPSSSNIRALREILAEELGRKTGRVSFDTASSMAAIGG